jgi:acetyl-CoA C-acetyltransferase
MDIYLLNGARTPVGSFLGSLSSFSASDLGAHSIKNTIEKNNLNPSDIDEVFMGQVVQAGTGQAPARQAAIKAGLPTSVQCTTVNKVCGSGLKTVIMAAQSIKAGDNKICIAGGMESMSNAPHLIPGSRGGHKYGNFETIDALQNDGLWDVYNNQPMGNCAEVCVEKYNMTREELDGLAIESFKRSQLAQENGVFNQEITPIEVVSRKGSTLVSEDEGPKKAVFEKIPKLRPAFKKDGKVTAANSSTINDGAASIVVGGDEIKDKAKFKIISYAGHAAEPLWFTTAPIESAKKCLEKANMSINEIDLFEINEAFAAVALASIKELELDTSKVNIYGSGISLGHPIGVSGTRILMSLMTGLERENKRFGMASICIGGGEALSMIIEKIK